MQEAVAAYERLSKYVEDYRLLTVIRFDAQAAVAFQQLKSSKLRLGTMDLRIRGQIALANDAMLWSRNLQDFQTVPGLKLEDPTR